MVAVIPMCFRYTLTSHQADHIRRRRLRLVPFVVVVFVLSLRPSPTARLVAISLNRTVKD